MDPRRFIAVMTSWREHFLQGADLPVIGATAEDLRSITVPACVVPGNDRTHPRRVGESASRLLPAGELHDLMGEDVDADLAVEAWDLKHDELAAILVEFLGRVSSPHAEAVRRT
jgi:hypothetical protein